MAAKRLAAELREIKNKPPELFSVGPYGEDIFHWRAYMVGPKGTPYERGTFQLDIRYPTDYPFKPPSVKFITKIFHPNIGEDGDICVDILQGQWSPAIKTETLLLSISSLLGNPNPADPLMPEAASLYTHDNERYNSVASEYTRKYAMF